MTISTMEEELFRVFNFRLSLDMVINNYWRLKFILSWVIRERESFGEMVKLTVIMFKEDVEHNMVHMFEVICISKPPYPCQ